MGNWRRDYIVAASLYCAIRLSSLPVTLVDLSGAMHVDMFALGRHYHEALKVGGGLPGFAVTSCNSDHS